MQNNAVVHIVDDDEAVRQSLAFLLSTAGMAVRVYDSASAFLTAVDTVQTGCLITDVRMPEINGLELLQRLRALKIELPAIVITGHGDIPLAVEAMKAGARDFIEKPFEEEEILRAVRVALDQGAQAEQDHDEKSRIATRLASLSTRERQVLDGLVEGHQNKIIAFDLGISPRTVEIYRANVMSKMEARSLSDLVRMALLGQISGGRPKAPEG